MTKKKTEIRVIRVPLFFWRQEIAAIRDYFGLDGLDLAALGCGCNRGDLPGVAYFRGLAVDVLRPHLSEYFHRHAAAFVDESG